MTREIKFRAWNLDEGYMLDSESLASASIRFLEKREAYSNDLKTYKYEIMQFTGFKDKNGKEIFEGDIVEVVCDWHDDFKKRFAVDLSKCHLWLKGERFGYEGENLIDPDDVILLGNIYKNPELLNQQKQ